MKASGVAVWRQDDEVSLLKAMVEFEKSKQTSPYAAMGEFLEFVRPSLSFHVQRRELTDKLWKLKQKFLTNKYDANIHHHANLLDLSEAITSWREEHANITFDGPNDVTDDDPNASVDNVVLDVNVVKSGKKGKLVSGDGEKENVGMDDEEDDVAVDKIDAKKGEQLVKDKSKVGVVTDDQNIEEDATEVVSDAKSTKKNVRRRRMANELEEGWAYVHLMEMELKLKKLDLISKQMKLILEATLWRIPVLIHEVELQHVDSP
ncbi:hypothetical protein AgCh_033938 [Apium graveolens]